MSLPVRLYTDPILSKVCKPVEDFKDLELETLIQEMIDTMMSNNGVGLAAPQVGIDKQIAILHVENRTRIMVVINPVILNYTKEKDKLNEGCLSAPGISISLKRWKGVDVEFSNISGERVQMRFTDYDARILQHEFDHLNGKCIVHTLKNYALVI